MWMYFGGDCHEMYYFEETETLLRACMLVTGLVE